MLDLSRATKHQTLMDSLEKEIEDNAEQNEARNDYPVALQTDNMVHGSINVVKEDHEDEETRTPRKISKRKISNPTRIENDKTTKRTKSVARQSKPVLSLSKGIEHGKYLEYSGDSEASLSSSGKSDDLKEFSVPYQEHLLHKLERQQQRHTRPVLFHDHESFVQRHLILKILYEQRAAIESLSKQTDHLIRLVEQ